MAILLNKIFMILSLLVAIVIHEYSHGWIAEKLGDSTARNAGRLSFNPLVHIDPVGTLLIPGILLIMGSPPFGWAKPVPVNYYNLNNPKEDMAKVALAGAGANFMIATAAALLLRISNILPIHLINLIYAGYDSLTNPFINFLGYLIFINLILGVFNLIPIPPLDGSKVVQALLPGHLAWQYRKLEPYGFIILIFLLFFLNGFGILILPVVELILRLYSLH